MGCASLSSCLCELRSAWTDDETSFASANVRRGLLYSGEPFSDPRLVCGPLLLVRDCFFWAISVLWWLVVWCAWYSDGCCRSSLWVQIVNFLGSCVFLVAIVCFWNWKSNPWLNGWQEDCFSQPVRKTPSLIHSKLDCTNYRVWTKILEMHIVSWKKGYISGLKTIPAETDQCYDECEADDAPVKSWLITPRPCYCQSQ